MRVVRRTTQFRRDLRLAERRRLDLSKLEVVLDRLLAGHALPPVNRDHALKGGEWRGCRECHIQPDWLLIYRDRGDELELVRTGTHSDLFG
jgi:mRNA interferase YafQ